MSVLSVGQIQGLSPSNQIIIDSKVKLSIEGILRLSNIQNSSGMTTFSSTSQGSLTLSGNLVTSQDVITTNLQPSRLITNIWTTSTRPQNPITGTFGFNETIFAFEVYNGNSWQKVTGISPTSAAGDQYWNNVSLLVKNGSAIDYTGRHIVTPTGNATTTTVVPPFKTSGSSWSLGQNTSSGINYTNNLSDFSLGSNTVWTLEFWVYLLNTNVYPHYFVPGGQGSQGTFKAWWNGSTYRPYMYTGNGLIVGSNTNSNITSANQWVWMVYQRDGANMRIWINGNIYETSTSGGTIPTSTPGSCLSGYWSGESVPFYIDELRLTMGVARYGTSNIITVQNATWPTNV